MYKDSIGEFTQFDVVTNQTESTGGPNKSRGTEGLVIGGKKESYTVIIGSDSTGVFC
jgi:hypothetical protein